MYSVGYPVGAKEPELPWYDSSVLFVRSFLHWMVLVLRKVKNVPSLAKLLYHYCQTLLSFICV